MIIDLKRQTDYVKFRAERCSICDIKIFRGEKNVSFWFGKRVSLCHNCLIKLGEIGLSIKEDNEAYTKIPERQRLKSWKAIEGLER